jgi:hypothetical protein
MTGATVTLLLSGTNTLKSGENRAGLQSPAGSRGFVRPAASSSNKPTGEVSPPPRSSRLRRASASPSAGDTPATPHHCPPRHCRPPRHCAVHVIASRDSGVAIHVFFLDCFASLAMTCTGCIASGFALRVTTTVLLPYTSPGAAKRRSNPPPKSRDADLPSQEMSTPQAKSGRPRKPIKKARPETERMTGGNRMYYLNSNIIHFRLKFNSKFFLDNAANFSG